MKSFEAFRKILRTAAVSLAVFLTVTTPACTYLSPEASGTSLVDALPDSHSAAYDASREAYDANQEPSSVTQDYFLDHKTYNPDGDLRLLELPHEQRVELVCLAYRDEATCKKLAAKHLRNELKDRISILRRHGTAALEKYPRFAKSANQKVHKHSSPEPLELLSKADHDKALWHEDHNDDFGLKLTDPALKRRSMDEDLGGRMPDTLTRSSGNFGSARNSIYYSERNMENGRQGTLRDLTGVDPRINLYSPEFVNMLGRPHYSAGSSSFRNPYHFSPKGAGRYSPLSVNADGLPAEDPFDSEEFQKFKRSFEKEVNLPVRMGYARFSPTKPNLGPTHLIEKNSGSGRSGRSLSTGREVAVDVCPSTSDWVSLTEARDTYGTTIKVLSAIPYNGTIVRQYFYETFCDHKPRSKRQMNWTEPGVVEEDEALIDEPRECMGIDTKVWNSRCRERLIWTYGMVVKADGDVGWGVMAIRGSCSCSVWPRDQHEGRRPTTRLFIDDV